MDQIVLKIIIAFCQTASPARLLPRLMWNWPTHHCSHVTVGHGVEKPVSESFVSTEGSSVYAPGDSHFIVLFV